MDVFKIAVARTLETWPALQFAVAHGLGGIDSSDKEKWLVDVIVQWYSENSGIEDYELEDFVTEILDNEFNAKVDDGSLLIICRKICSFFNLCNSGRSSEVVDEISKFMKPNIESYQPDQSDSDDDISINTPSDDPVTNCNGQNYGNVVIENSIQNNFSNDNVESMDTDDINVENDGWTVVAKGKKKK